MRILITGGVGQLGRALQKALADDEVCAPGHNELDVTHAEAVRNAICDVGLDVVIHAAAWTDTAACERDPERALAINGEGSRLVGQICREAGVAMVYVSTNEVFDGEKRSNYEEGDPPNPLNAYGRSKLEGEQAMQTTLERFWIVRTSWLYGPGRASFPEKIIQAAREQGALKLVTDEIASPTLTIDLAQAIARLIRLPNAWGLYHLTNSGVSSRKEWAEEVLRLAGTDIPVEPITQAEFGAPYRKPTFSALANVRAARLGIELRPWQEALQAHFRYTANKLGTSAQASGRIDG